MRKIVARIVAASLVLAFSIATVAPSQTLCPAEGREAPDFTLENVAGEPVTLSDHRGKPVLAVFWASWCPRCMQQLAFLQGLHMARSKDLTILAINQETQTISPTHFAKLKAELEVLGIEFPVLLDRDLTVWGSYCISSLPTTLVLDSNGRIRFAEANYYWATRDKIKAVLEELGVSVP